MNRMTWIFAFLLLASGSIALGQTANSSAPSTVGQVLDSWVTNTERLVVPAADAMPEEKYPFAPTNGEFKGVRTFAEQLKHLAAANYQLGALILDERPPGGEKDETAPASVRTKAEVMKYVKGSFAYLHRAAATITDRNMIDKPDGNRTRLWLLIDAVAHSSNHYGQIVEYLRMNGIVPPASR